MVSSVVLKLVQNLIETVQPPLLLYQPQRPQQAPAQCPPQPRRALQPAPPVSAACHVSIHFRCLPIRMFLTNFQIRC